MSSSPLTLIQKEEAMRYSRKTLMVFICLTLMLGVGPAWGKTFKFDMANEYAPTSIHGENDMYFIKTLQKLSGGQIQITHHPGASLGYKSKDQFDAVTDGALPIADTFVGPLRGIHPVFLLSSLPFLAKTIDDAKMLWAVSKPYYEKVLRNSNQILLFASPWPPSGLWANKPIRSLEDLKNLKIRTYDPNGTITLKNAGAAPIQLSWSDVVPQLGTGGIDAVLTSAEGGVSSKFWDLLSHFTEINYSSPLNMIHMNADAYNKLPADLQKAVMQAADMTNDFAWDAAYGRVQQNYKDMRENGMTVVTDVPADFLDQLAEAGKPAIDEWVQKMPADAEKILSDYHRKIGQ
jgi:TRAP-type C4-dicarboxylate transport system substrate-binding protein